MSIREMSREDCFGVLRRAKFAKLACSSENQPYVVPVFLALHEPHPGEGCLYGFTTRGQKVEWMRANPLVCAEVDEVRSPDEWVSVIAFGRYEELPEVPGRDDARLRAGERPRQSVEDDIESLDGEDERDRAYRLLQSRLLWWEPGSSAWEARPGRDPAEPYVPIYYKISIDRITGHESIPDPRSGAASAVTAPPAGEPPDRGMRSR